MERLRIKKSELWMLGILVFGFLAGCVNPDVLVTYCGDYRDPQTPEVSKWCTPPIPKSDITPELMGCPDVLQDRRTLVRTKILGVTIGDGCATKEVIIDWDRISEDPVQDLDITIEP